MSDYPKLTVQQRRALEQIGRRRRGAMAMGVAFGAGPGQGAPAPAPGEYYEMSEYDRALIEQVIADNEHPDAHRRKTALEWWSRALELVGPGAGLTLGAYAGSVVLDLMGRSVLQPFRVDSPSVVTLDNGHWSGVIMSFTVGQPYEVYPDTYKDVNGSVSFTLRDWQCEYNSGSDRTFWSIDGMFANVKGGQLLTTSGRRETPANFVANGDKRVGLGICPSPLEAATDWTEEPPHVPKNSLHGSFGMTFKVTDATACLQVGLVSPTGAQESYSTPVCSGQDLSPLEFLPPTFTDEPPTEGLDPIDPNDLIPPLEDYPFRPEPCDPVGDPGEDPGGPIPEPPPPGPGPVPSPPPVEPPPPIGNPPLPPLPPYTDPVDGGVIDPITGGCVTLPAEPPGFRDPTQPGAIGARYQPGRPMSVSTGDDEAYTSRISRVAPSANGGGPRMCVDPIIPPDPGVIPQKTCYSGKVTDIIRSVLVEMGVRAQIIFDSDCTKVVFPAICYDAGTPRRTVLRHFLDMCGFCVFPQFDGNVIVGYCTPLDVHWYYHEDVDLIGFDLEYDNREAYAYVEVFRPPRYNRAGAVLEDGYSVPVPVATPFAVDPSKVLQIEVPYGFPQTEALALARNRAANLARQAAPLTSFAVPLNAGLRLRHQIHVQRPSLGFRAVYVVTRLQKEYTRQAYLNRGLARWLRAE